MTNRLKPTLSILHLWGIAVALMISGSILAGVMARA